jgi:hypothetical protein
VNLYGFLGNLTGRQAFRFPGFHQGKLFSGIKENGQTTLIPFLSLPNKTGRNCGDSRTNHPPHVTGRDRTRRQTFGLGGFF